MQLLNGLEYEFTAATYNFAASVPTGSIDITMSIDGSAFVALENGSFTADGSGIMLLTTCLIKATIAGTAELYALNQNGNGTIRQQ